MIINMTNNYQLSKYIVDIDGSTPYATIQEALDQIVEDYGATPAEQISVAIRPGSYTEDLTLVQNVSLIGVSEGQVFINGMHTPPTSGYIMFQGIKFNSAVDTLFDVVNAGTTEIKFYDCTFSNNLGYAVALTNYTGPITIESCNDISPNNGCIFNTGGAAVEIIDSQVGTGAAHMTLSGFTRIINSGIGCPVDFTANSAVRIDSSRFTNTVYALNNAQVAMYNSSLSSAAECYDTSSTQTTHIHNCTFDCPGHDIIVGTGSVSIGEIVAPNDYSIAGTITVERIPNCIVSNSNVLGVIHLPSTEDTGFGGVINVNGERFVHAMGTRNTFIGEEAGNFALTVGSAIENTGCGFEALRNISAGSGNSAFGVNSGNNYTNESNNICIANTGTVGDNNTIRIGQHGVGAHEQDSCYIAGISYATHTANIEVVCIDDNHKLAGTVGGHGEILIGNTGGYAAWANITAGINVAITDGPNSITVDCIGAAGSSWAIATADLTAVPFTSYFVNMTIPGLCTITLPAVGTLGDIVEISGYSVGLWRLAQTAADIIYTTGNVTTLGIAGSVSATNQYDSIKIVCMGDIGGQTVWKVVSSIGVLNFI